MTRKLRLHYWCPPCAGSLPIPVSLVVLQTPHLSLDQLTALFDVTVSARLVENYKNKQSIAAQGEAFCNPRHWREAPLGRRNPGSYFPWHEALSRLSLPPRGEFGSSRHPLQSCCEPGLPGYPSSWVPACLSSTAERNELGEWAVWWFHGWVPLSDSGPTPPSCWDWHPQLVENN